MRIMDMATQIIGDRRVRLCGTTVPGGFPLRLQSARRKKHSRLDRGCCVELRVGNGLEKEPRWACDHIQSKTRVEKLIGEGENRVRKFSRWPQREDFRAEKWQLR